MLNRDSEYIEKKEKRDKENFYICMGFLFLIGWSVIVLVYGVYMGDSSVRIEAIKNNVAEYTVDKKTGKTSFIWKFNNDNKLIEKINN